MSSTEDNNFEDEGERLDEQKERSWRNRAYEEETEEVPRLLYELCRTIVSAPHTSRGPKPLPVGDNVQCMVLKVFFGRSAARTIKLLERFEKMGRISRTPSANGLLYMFNEADLTVVLHYLIGLSSKQLISYENWFGYDGTSLAMRDYLDFTGTYTANKEKGHRYVMLQTIAGLQTRIIPAAFVDVCLEKHFSLKHDSQFVEDLLRRTMALGFKVTALWGDKAYHSKKNSDLAKDKGIENHITPRRKKGKKRAESEAETKDPQMRIRNGVETVFSMIKQVFGENVVSRKET